MIETVAELDRVREDCRQLVNKRAMTAAASSMVPIPGLDLIADVGLLTKLLPGYQRALRAERDAGPQA